MLYFILFVASLGISALAIPILRHTAIRYGIMIDEPDERKLHAAPIPCNGGIGIALASFTAIAMGFAINHYMYNGELNSIVGITLGGVFILLLGVLDDIKDLNAYKKFLGQIIAALTLILLDIRIRTIGIPFWHTVDLSPGVSIFITVFWVLAATNALNLIDGMDGLAGGVALIASVVLFIIAVAHGNMLSAIVTISLIGSCSGFLLYNFPPANIFMGDCGSMFLGFTLAAVSIQYGYKSSIVSILVPITVLAVPLADTSLAIVRRLWNGSNPFTADRGHIHHRLLDLGLSERFAVMILYGLCILLGIITLVATFVNKETAAIIIVTTGVSLISALALISQHASKRNDEGRRKQHTLKERYHYITRE